MLRNPDCLLFQAEESYKFIVLSFKEFAFTRALLLTRNCATEKAHLRKRQHFNFLQ